MDALAAELRTTGARFPGGDSKLRMFYFHGTYKVRDKGTPLAWPRQIRQLREWAAARPGSVTARIGLAYGLLGYAWDARGGGYASSITDSAEALMAARLLGADSALAAARVLPVTCPGWWQVALKVADMKGVRGAEWERLYQEAIAQAPDSEAYYLYKAAHLLPRWYGRPGEWEAYADSVADALPPPEGDKMYARMAWYVMWQTGSDDYFKDNHLSWPRVNRGYDEMIRSFPESVELPSQAAVLAGIASDTVHLRARIVQLGNRVDVGVWGSREVFARARQAVSPPPR